MPVPCSFHTYQNYLINESRMAKMLSCDREKATYMGLWDRIKDLFRAEKKQEALNALYDLVYGNDKFNSFYLLKTYACEAYRDRFVSELDSDNNIIFSIDGQRVGSCPLTQALHLPDSAELLTMEKDEENLIFSMLESLCEKNRLLPPDSPFDAPRKAMARELSGHIYTLYRPGETVESEAINWTEPAELTDESRKKLGCLNAGDFAPSTQFSKMGYQQTTNGTEFMMVHPIITFLLGSYVNSFEYAELCNRFLTIYNAGYKEYNDNKSTIDPILQTIYAAHSSTLNIVFSEENRNMLTAK